MQTKTKVIIGCAVLGAGIIGLSVFLAFSDDGQININDRIINADQSGFKQEVRPDSQAVVPNGGLTPQGGGPVAEPPKPVPETPPEGTASSTEGGAEGGEVTPAPEGEEAPAQ